MLCVCVCVCVCVRVRARVCVCVFAMLDTLLLWWGGYSDKDPSKCTGFFILRFVRRVCEVEIDELFTSTFQLYFFCVCWSSDLQRCALSSSGDPPPKRFHLHVEVRSLHACHVVVRWCGRFGCSLADLPCRRQPSLDVGSISSCRCRRSALGHRLQEQAQCVSSQADKYALLQERGKQSRRLDPSCRPCGRRAVQGISPCLRVSSCSQFSWRRAAWLDSSRASLGCGEMAAGPGQGPIGVRCRRSSHFTPAAWLASGASSWQSFGRHTTAACRSTASFACCQQGCCWNGDGSHGWGKGGWTGWWSMIWQLRVVMSHACKWTSHHFGFAEQKSSKCGVDFIFLLWMFFLLFSMKATEFAFFL